MMLSVNACPVVSLMLVVLLAPALCSSVRAAPEALLETDGIRVKSISAGKPGKISLEHIGRFQVVINVDPVDGGNEVELQVEVAETGPKTWPAEDLSVADKTGRAVPIRRNGDQWHRFNMMVPGVRGAYTVRAVAPDDANRSARLPAEAERTASDRATGVSASICRWYGGRDAALSIRFDDSHPTHLKTAVPILRECGFRATFMINPGTPDFLAHRAEWEACARRAEHEFANHTLSHRGATTDEEVEREIGQVSEYIWRLFPERSRLVALNCGGGTVWVTRKPFRHYLDKYHLFNVSGSLGMDDVYGNRIDALERHLLNAIERGGWAKVHYHAIGAGLATSEDNFRAAMQLVGKHADRLWIAGLADAYKYHQERTAAKVALKRVATDRVEMAVSCATDLELYDHPLTIQFNVPPDWSAARLSVVRGEKDLAPIAECVVERKRNLILCHVPPVSRCYVLSRDQ